MFLFTYGYFQDFLFISVFQQCVCDAPSLVVFVCIFHWVFLIYDLGSSAWKNCWPLSFQKFLCFIFLFFFWDSNYTRIKPFDMFTGLRCSVFLPFATDSFFLFYFSVDGFFWTWLFSLVPSVVISPVKEFFISDILFFILTSIWLLKIHSFHFHAEIFCLFTHICHSYFKSSSDGSDIQAWSFVLLTVCSFTMGHITSLRVF